MEDNQRVCPYCAEDIDKDCVFCPHCKTDLNSNASKVQNKDALILTSIILGVLYIIVVCVFIYLINFDPQLSHKVDIATIKWRYDKMSTVLTYALFASFPAIISICYEHRKKLSIIITSVILAFSSVLMGLILFK